MEDLTQTMRRDQQGAGKYLAFRLGEEEFAVPVDRIREIIPMQATTPVPRAAAHVVGVFNLRGRVVPVMDLRRRLGMPAQEPDGRTCIVVMEPGPELGRSPVGVVVDGVSEVVQIPAADVEDTASLAAGWIQAGFVHRIANSKGKVRLLLEVDGVLTAGMEDGDR